MSFPVSVLRAFTSFIPSFSAAPAQKTPDLSSAEAETKHDQHIPIDDEVMQGRLKHLASQSTRRPFIYNMNMQVPVYGEGMKEISLSFPLNLEVFLQDCHAMLKSKNIHAEHVIQFKGGAVPLILDGHPKDLHDCDATLKLSPAIAPMDWRIVREVIFICLEKQAGLVRTEKERERFVTYTQEGNDKFNIRMSKFDDEGNFRSFLFEQPGAMKLFWCANDFFRKQGEEYILARFFTSVLDRECPLEVEFAARHKNSATCSIDAIRVNYPLDGGKPYFSTVDGYDLEEALRLRDLGFFTVDVNRIKKGIRHGFMRYNSILLKGYLPTSLAFEQAYGEYLAAHEDAIAEIEKDLEKYVREHCASPQKQLQYLLISYNTLSRLNIPEHTMKRLKQIYETMFATLFDVKGNVKEFVQDASLLLFLYFETFTKDLKYKEKPLCKKYETGQLTRYFGKDGKRGIAFVFETSKLPSQKEAQEKLKKILDANHALRKCFGFFVPDAAEWLKLLGQDVVEVEAPSAVEALDFKSYLEKPEHAQWAVKRHAKKIVNLFAVKPESLAHLDSANQQKLRKLIIEIFNKSTASLAASVFEAAYPHKILEEKEKTLLDFVEKLLASPGDVRQAKRLCLLAASDPEISLKTRKALFGMLMKSSVDVRFISEFMSVFPPNKEFLKDVMQMWAATLEKIMATPAAHTAITTFWKHFNIFIDSCKDSNMIEALAPGVAPIVDMTIRLLNGSKDEQMLRCAYEVQKQVDSPCFEGLSTGSLEKECWELIQKGIKHEVSGIISLYLECQYDLFDEEMTEKFLSMFPLFVSKALLLKKMDIQVIQAINDGIHYFVRKKYSPEAARMMLERLKKVSQDESFPEALQQSIDLLEKYCEVKKYYKFTLEGFKMAIASIEKDQDFEDAVDLFRVLLPDAEDEMLLHSLHVNALKLFEAALTKPEKSPLFVICLYNLSDLIKYEGWKDDQAARFEACVNSLSLIPKPVIEKQKPEPKKEAPKNEHKQIKVKIPDRHLKAVQDNPTNLKAWDKVFKTHVINQNHAEIISWGHKYLEALPKVLDLKIMSTRAVIMSEVGYSYIMLGQPSKAMMLLHTFQNYFPLHRMDLGNPFVPLFAAIAGTCSMDPSKTDLAFFSKMLPQVIDDLDRKQGNDDFMATTKSWVLVLLEHAMKNPKKTPEYIECLRTLSKVVGYKKWNASERVRYEKCLKALDELEPAGKSKSDDTSGKKEGIKAQQKHR